MLRCTIFYSNDIKGGFNIAEFEDILYPTTPQTEKMIAIGNQILDETLRYGVYIFEMVYHENKHRTALADTVLSAMFREAMEVVDGISILLQNCCVVAARLLVRTLLEIYAQFNLIAGENSNEKAIAYWITHLHTQINILQKDILEGIIEREKGEKQIARIETLLNNPDYKMINDSWINFPKKYPPNWYNIITPPVPTINALLGTLHDGVNTKVVYGYLSRSAHGYGILDNLIFGDDQISIDKLRNPQGFAGVVNYTVLLLSCILELMIQLYLNNEDKDNLEIWLSERVVELDELRLLS